MEHASTFLGDLALVLVVAAATSIVFRLLRQPVVLGYLLTGLIVGPHTPIPLVADVGRVTALAEFGVVLVMFSIGLEFSFRRLTRVLPAAGLPALVQMSVLGWLGLMVGRALGWSDLECIFLGACLAISSTMVVARALAEVEVPRPSAELALGVLITQDLVAVLAIAGLTALVGGAGLGGSELAARGGELLLFLAGLVVLGLLLVPRLVRRLVRLGSPEMLVVAATGLCFGLALLAEKMGYSVALGAFVAGSLVAESGEEPRVERLVRPIRDLFAAVFFVAIGMAVEPRLVLDNLGVASLLIVVIIVGQLLSVTLGGTLAGRGLATSVRSGAALGQIGEFSFIIATLGIASGAVRPALYPMVVIAALVTTFTTPLVLRLADRIAVSINAALPVRVRTMLSLYASWVQDLPERARRSLRRTRLRRYVGALVLDTAALVALALVGLSAYRGLAASLSRQLGLPAAWGVAVVGAGTILLASPFAWGILRSARGLGLAIAGAALPTKEGGLDLADAPRRAMAVLLQTGLVLLSALVFVAATQPFMPARWGLVVLGAAFAGLALVAWRTAGDLEGHVRAGAQAFAESLLQRRRTRPVDIESLLPGMGDMTQVEIGPEAHGAGSTLAALNLRGHTGATVLAVRRGEHVHTLPGGEWVLEPGDVVGLTGSHDAVARARDLLVTGASE